MMRNILKAFERLRKRFDLSAHKAEDAKLEQLAQAKRPPKRKRRR